MDKRILLSLIPVIFFSLVFTQPARAQAQTCSAGPGGLCYGISNNALCSTSLLTDCSSYPRCAYSGTISGYYCHNHCYNTGQAGSCGSGMVCLCVDSNPCPLCTASGQNLSECNDAGCGLADSTPPAVVINSPTSLATYATTVSPIDVGGTASDNGVITQVSWSNNRNAGFVGGSGTATGTSSWNASCINLEPGGNIITVNATDGAGNTGTDSITVTYSPPPTPGYPSITLAENATAYNVSINDSDPLTEVAYAWGAVPNVYFLVPFTNDSNPALSSAEKVRYNYLISSLPAAWDSLTLGKHPLNFYFIEPFVVNGYSSAQNDLFAYVSAAINKFNTSYPESLKHPAVYVILYPEPYFNRTYVNIFGSEAKNDLAEIYFDDFNDAGYASDEVMTNILLHEITHAFALLPSNVNIPPGSNKYFWLSHPAGFYGSGGTCDESTSLIDCPPYGSSESPTGTEGYYEAYSILSLRIDAHTRSQMQNRDPELSPLVEMALGIRSRYEDANYTYYEGFFNSSGFNLVAAHDYGISSRRLLDYDSVERQAGIYWDIRFDSQKVHLPNTTRSFSLEKSAQAGRALIVFASDHQNPGYFKAFGANARSNTTIIGGAITCADRSDSNCDGCVSNTELTAFIDRWKFNNQDVTIREIISAIGKWKAGC